MLSPKRTPYRPRSADEVALPRMRRARKAAVSIRSVQHARAVLEAWRHDYNEQRPHSKLGWMTPGAYASALSGEAGRDAAPRRGSAPRPLATHQTEGSNQLRVPGSGTAAAV
jgi:hypothetical protein